MTTQIVAGGRFALGLKIEGIGDPSGGLSDGRFRWVSLPLSQFDDDGLFDLDGVYKPSTLLYWPKEFSFELDFRRGEVRLGGQTFELRGTPDVWKYALRQSRPVVANLQADISSTDDTIVLDASLGDGATIHIGREAILLGTEAGAGPFTYTFCTRGVLGTSARPHSASVTEDPECFAEIFPSSLAGRLVEFFRIPLGAQSYADEETLWYGVLREITSPNAQTVVIQTANALDLVRGTTIMRDQWRGRYEVVFEADGTFVFQGLERGQTPDAGYGTDPATSRAVFCDGERAFVSSWSIGQRGLARGGQPLPGELASFAGSANTQNAPSAGAALWETLSTHEQQPDIGGAGVRLPQSAAELILTLLLTTEEGGNHPTYDLGVPNLAGDIPAVLVDVDGIEAWGRRWPVTLDNFHLGLDGEPENLWNVIQKRILQPLGAILSQSNGGRLSVAFLRDTPLLEREGGAGSITSSQIVTVGPGLRRQIVDAIDRTSVKYGQIPGAGHSTLNLTDARKLRRQPRGTHDTLQLDLGGVSDLEQVRALTQSMLTRYHRSLLRVDFETLRTANFWPGDVARVTAEYLPRDDDNPAGGVVRSVVNNPYLIVSRRERYADDGHTMAYGALDVGALYTNQGAISPSASVASWDGGASTFTVLANAYTNAGAAGDPFTRDAAAFQVGDLVDHCDEFGTVVNADLTITNIIGDDITVSGAVGPAPGVGDVLVFASYGSSTASQRTDFYYIADADGRVGGGAADAYNYTRG